MTQQTRPEVCPQENENVCTPQLPDASLMAVLFIIAKKETQS